MLNEVLVCCPTFDPERWNRKTFGWDEKQFILDTIPTFFHVPFPPMIGKKIERMYQLAENANANMPDRTDTLVLFRDPSAFRSEIYYSVCKRVEEATNATISGTFRSLVFDGPYNAIPKYMKQMEDHLAEEDQQAKDYYVHYAYCPKCAKESGHNFILLFARI